MRGKQKTLPDDNTLSPNGCHLNETGIENRRPPEKGHNNNLKFKAKGLKLTADS
jgi:hypothetical protein